ncbi:MAG: hypothetical protein HY685_05735, partial [Chloroflexi bacterium]|nr:hypothetical protein [Chloroflexota bacterium]
MRLRHSDFPIGLLWVAMVLGLIGVIVVAAMNPDDPEKGTLSYGVILGSGVVFVLSLGLLLAKGDVHRYFPEELPWVALVLGLIGLIGMAVVDPYAEQGILSYGVIIAFGVVAFFGFILLAAKRFAGNGDAIKNSARSLHLESERRAAKNVVERLLALQPPRSWNEWTLPAPESYTLLRGGYYLRSDAFELGLLQLIAMGVLAPGGEEAPEGGGGDTPLRRGPAAAHALAGSLVSIYRLWADPDVRVLVTVKQLARQARQEYGSLDGFADQVVVEELVKAGLYTREGGRTPAGEAARADLESRVAGVLHEIQQRRASRVEKEPRQALVAAVIAVAVGLRRPPVETEPQTAEQQVEQGTVMTAAPQEASVQSDVWLDERFFNRFA